LEIVDHLAHGVMASRAAPVTTWQGHLRALPDGPGWGRRAVPAEGRVSVPQPRGRRTIRAWSRSRNATTPRICSAWTPTSSRRKKTRAANTPAAGRRGAPHPSYPQPRFELSTARPLRWRASELRTVGVLERQHHRAV